MFLTLCFFSVLIPYNNNLVKQHSLQARVMRRSVIFLRDEKEV